MVSRSRMVLAVAFGVGLVGVFAAPAAMAANTIFWTNAGPSDLDLLRESRRSSADPSHPQHHWRNSDAPWGVAPDPATGKIYWAN